ncbi:MAG TPA: VOC family protein [Phototrophicaceae bacterium]|nr:VOC family protein [Phototrophicaceae bacterium]
MKQAVTITVFPVADFAKAKAVYTKLLGIEPYADSPYYVGYRIGDQEIGLARAQDSVGLTGSISYFDVDDIKGTLQTLVAAGATIQQDAHNVGGGLLVAWVKDADGNIFGLRQGK